MIDYEQALYNVTVPDDATYSKDATEPYPGGGEGSKNVTLYDVFQQFNFTVDDDEEQQIGYTPRVELGPKCFVTQRPLDFVYEKYNDTYNITEAAIKDNKELLERI